MKEETLVSIYEVIKKYVIQKNNHPDYVNFYGLYDVDMNVSDSEFKTQVTKKARKFFHPDRILYIDEQYRDLYLEIAEKNKDLYEYAEDSRKREEYNNFLMTQKMIEREKEKSRQKEEGPQHFYDGKANPFTKSREEEQAEPKPENHFEANSSKQENNSNGFREDSTYNQTEEFKKNLDSIKSAVETMIFKYGFEAAYNSLIELLHGNFSAMTRDNNIRQKMADIGLKDLRKTVQYANLAGNPADNTMDIFVDVLDRAGIRERTEDFYSSCDEIERQKGNGSVGLYDLLHEKVYNNDPTADYFLDRKHSHTTNQGREFSPNDIKFLMYAKVHKNRNGDESLAFSKLGNNPKGVDYLIENYCNMVSVESKKYYQGY